VTVSTIVHYRVGLEILIEDELVFRCHGHRGDAIWFAELGSSRAIMEAGYSIASFMLR
jgi:hypothetical protein